MAAAPINAPGTPLGPCDASASCGHIDCRESVKMAASRCHLCSFPIGYDAPVYVEYADKHPGGFPVEALINSMGNPYVFVHAVCLERLIVPASPIPPKGEISR